MVSLMELLDRAVAYTGKRVHSLRSDLVKAEDVRKAKRVPSRLALSLSTNC